MRRSYKIAIVGTCSAIAFVIGGLTITGALAADDPANSPPDPAAAQRFSSAEFVPTADEQGNTVGYVKGPANTSPGEQLPGGVQEVYKNPDGSGGIVGYVADFGFIDKATYDAPGFNLDAMRAEIRAQIEANARKSDPNFDLGAVEQQLQNRATDPHVMTPTTTTP